MLKLFYPYEYVESVFSIDYGKLYKSGYKGIIFDIDNTLVHHGDDSTKEIDDLVKSIQKIGFKTLLLSNNGESRVKSFLKNIDSLYICNAEKPSTKNYKKALKMMELKKEEVICIGDQIFYDVLGANRSKMANILVKFIQLNNEEKIGKTREIEKIILELYSKNRKFQNRLGDILKEEEK